MFHYLEVYNAKGALISRQEFRYRRDQVSAMKDIYRKGMIIQKIGSSLIIQNNQSGK